jgi:tetratricopeptide (TPR) repeat protein
VLLIGRKATGEEIAAAAEVRLALLAQHRAERPELARERPRVDEIRAAYATARDVLLDDRRRSAYDRELAGGELVQVPPSLDIELTFRTAEELIARKQWPQALGLLKKIIAQLPTEADYHAALGWAEWHAGGRNPSAADTARASLNQALAINPDHPAAHDYKGQIDAALRNDDAEALFHLERAVELDPRRADALAALSALLITRGELRRLERILKRQLFRARGKDPVLEAKAWVRLARLYAEHLDDLGAATGALTTARRLAPRDSDVGNLVRDLDGKSPRISGPIRTGWRAALGDPAAGAALVRTTVASGHNDAAFLAASTMVALGTADVAMAAAYEAGRVRGIVLPATRLSAAQWAMLRHREDTLELGGLIELLAPAVHRLAPMTLAAAELEPAMRLDADALPPVFAQVLAACANLLGVPVPDVYARAELGGQIHVVACDPPVLVAGDDALLLPERPDLVFRIVRALTFLWPGRAVGASRPGRVLRAVALAMFREASAADIGRDEPLAPAATEALAALTPDARTQARAASLRLLARGSALNLSNWARALTRTADRAGLLLCGDVPAAFAGARDVGELDRDLLDFAFAGSHVVLRRELGLVGPT